MPVRSSKAVWHGDLPSGSGTMTIGDGVYEGAYSFPSRFQEGNGTNPEELLAAAHAGCYSMALSHGLAQAGHIPTRVHTVAHVHLGPDPEGGFHISKIELHTEADVPGLGADAFQEQAEAAKQGCPVSKLFTGAEISLEAKLVS